MVGQTRLDALVVPSDEGNLEGVEIFLALQVFLEIFHVSPDAVHQSHPHRVQLEALYQLGLQLPLPNGLVQQQILLGLRVGSEVDAFAANGADLGVLGGHQNGEYNLALGEFDLVVVAADGLLQVLAVVEELEGGVGEGDLPQCLTQHLLPRRLHQHVEDLVIGLRLRPSPSDNLLDCLHVIIRLVTIISNMSEQLEMSGESSMDRNFQIRTNNEGENELYIPCWEEEGSNSTQYHHLIEETKFFKNKCKHLENHLEENHREFSSLNQLYLIAEANERRLLKDNEDLKRHNRDLMGELSETKIARDANAAELYACAKRESELREKVFKNREREGELSGEVEALRTECDGLRRKGAQGGEEERWKRYYNDQIAKVEQQWKAAYEELQGQFDRKSKELRDKQEQIKILNKNCNSHREDYEVRIRGLEGELDEARRQTAKFKAQASDFQRQIKELKLVRDDVSAKNDQIQAENSRLKKSQKEETAKYLRLAGEHQELQLSHEDLTARHAILGGETSNLKNALNELRLKLSAMEKELGEVRTDRDSAIITKNYVENAHSGLQQDFASFRKEKQGEIESLRVVYESKLKELKQSAFSQKTMLQNSIIALRQEIQALKAGKREGTKLDAANERVTQLQEENAALKDEILNWRGRYDRLSTQQQSPKQCHHEAEISDLKQEGLSWRSKHDKLREQVAALQDERNDLKRRIGEIKEEGKAAYAKLMRDIDELTIRFENMRDENERLTRQKKKLTEQKEKLFLERNTLLNDNEVLEREKNDFINERRQLLSEKKTTGEVEADSTRLRSLQLKLREKTKEIQRFQAKVRQLEEEIESLRSRPKDEGERERPEREKLKRYELRLKEKQQQLRELEERLEQLESEYESQRIKSKALEKDGKAKDSELNKRERKNKELQSSIQEMQTQLQSLEAANEKSKTTIENLKKQLKSQQNTSERLRTQIQRQDSEKQNWQNQEKNISSSTKLQEKERRQLEEQCRRVTIELKSKEEEIIEFKRQIHILKQSTKPAEPIKPDTTNFTLEIDSLRGRVRDLEQQLREKEEAIRRLQSATRRDDDLPSGTLEELQAEYNRELLALKRLIMYKGYREEEGRRVDELKADYEGKIQLMLADYRSMQQEMIILKEKVVAQRIAMPPEPSIEVEEVWRVRLDHISQQREVLIEKVAMWERKYEELRFLFEAKLESKEETINLLNLKLSNLEMARPHCQYSCQHL